MKFLLVGWAISVAVCLAPPARALDKQGSAHGGDVEGAATGAELSGSLAVGVSLANHSYAARPDNTGLTLMRYAGHLDLDLIGRRLSVPLDLNFFTDRTRSGAKELLPSEFDLITGVTSTWDLGPGALEGGARIENDRPVDRGGATQTYLDARLRYLYALSKLIPGLADRLHDGDISGWATLGWFAYNPSYYARPDNTGRACLRYGLHTELSLWSDLLSLGLDGTMFTDRKSSDPVRPSELDLTPEIIFHLRSFEVHLAYEADMPIDRGGLKQRFLYLLGAWGFDLQRPHPAPFETRGQILSP